jgi:hypothetical protein
MLAKVNGYGDWGFWDVERESNWGGCGVGEKTLSLW